MSVDESVKGTKEKPSEYKGLEGAPAEIAELRSMVSELTGQMKGLVASQGKLQANQERVFSPDFIQALRGAPPQHEEEPVLDLNELDNIGMAKHIIQNVAGLLDERMGTFQKDMNVMRAHQRIDQVKSSHGDFDDYYPKMLEIWKKTPGMHPEEAYRLSKYGSDEAIKTVEDAQKAEDQKVLAATHQTGVPGVGSSFSLEDYKDLTPNEQIDAAGAELLTSFDE